MTSRSWAALSFVVLLIALGIAVAVLTPWQRPPAPRADQLAALEQRAGERGLGLWGAC
jgi:STE24 endopeptidase